MKIIRWCVILIVLWSGFAFTASAQPMETVNIPLMRLGTGDIGCGDELVWVQRQVEVPDATILAALRELLTLNPAVLEEEGLHNALLGRPVWIQWVWVSAGTADIELGGSLGVFDECEAYRIDAQLRQVALQFPDVNAVNITVADQPLEPVLDQEVVDEPVPPTPPEDPPNDVAMYTVVPTDTLSGIARRHNTTVAAILELNPHIVDPNLILVGQQLWIPGPDVAPPVDPPPTPAPPAPPPDEPVQTLRVPLIQLGTGDIGPGNDELVWVERQLPVPDAQILAVLRDLLALNPAAIQRDDLHNELLGRPVWIQWVWVSEWTADIELGGSLGTFDEAAAYRIDAQLREVALQFPTVNEVNILVGGQPLPQVLGIGN